MNKKILFIPHHPCNEKIKIRLVEIAKALASKYEVFYINWEAAQGNYTFLNRIEAFFKDFFKKRRLYKKYNITAAEFSTLHRPVSIARIFNRFWLMLFIKKNNIDIVINGSFDLFSLPDGRNFKYIYDLADYPKEGFCRQTIDEFLKCDAITAVSNELAFYLSKNFQKNAVFIPNGADLKKMRSVSLENIDALKKRFNLYGKWLIGYIGYIGAWVNIRLVVESFRIFKKEVPEAVLLWIGMSPEIDSLRKKYSADDIIFTGGIDEDIEPYFRMLDMGILPHMKSVFQDMAFHLKLVEYTAAGKPVVSVPLKESMRLGFPNVIFADEKPELWAESFKKAKNMKWQKEWDNLTMEYDWEKIGEKLVNLIEDNDQR